MRCASFLCGVGMLMASLPANTEPVRSPREERFSVSLGRASDAVSHSHDQFVSGERVIVRLQVRDEGDAGAFTLVWIDPFECVISRDTKEVKTTARAVVVQSKDTTSWRPGPYRVQIRRGNELIRVKSFEVVAQPR